MPADWDLRRVYVSQGNQSNVPTANRQARDSLAKRMFTG